MWSGKEPVKIAFCGLGSIGRRHLKNVVKYLSGRGVSYEIDAIRSGEGAQLDGETEALINAQYTYDDEIPRDYDVIFITNPTSMHTDCIARYAGCTRSMFIEKPLTDRLDFDEKTIPSDTVCYVACPLRYTKVLQYVRENVRCDEAYSVRAICSTYLPGWHPNEDYRKSYSAHSELGGGVSIDLIHEWDYLTWLFGEPDEVQTIRTKLSALEIDSDDTAIYIGRSEKRAYELHLDYFGRKEIRRLEIFLPNETVTVDIRANCITMESTGERLVMEEPRDDYQIREIAHFFDILEGKCENDNTPQHAMKVLRIAREG